MKSSEDRQMESCLGYGCLAILVVGVMVFEAVINSTFYSLGIGGFAWTLGWIFGEVFGFSVKGTSKLIANDIERQRLNKE